jgi:hypothetical protein
MKTVYANMVKGNTVEIERIGDGFLHYIRIALS